MVIHILISLVFYFVLLYLSVNLFGLFVRGLFSNSELDRLEKEGSDFVKAEVIKHKKADKKVTIFALLLLVAFFYALLHFWNVWVVVAAIMIIAGRFPDLLWEIKNGKRLTYQETKNLPHDILYFITAFLPWVAFPVLYYSLYYL